MSDTHTQSTALLIARANGGDEAAREALFAKTLPLLKRWASVRLPTLARDLAETEDLVQITLIRVLNNLQRFESRRVRGGSHFGLDARQCEDLPDLQAVVRRGSLPSRRRSGHF